MKLLLQQCVSSRPAMFRSMVLFAVVSLFCLNTIASQAVADSVSIDTLNIDASDSKEKKSSIFAGRPGKALLYSLVVPGTGQIYSKSYLRVPFVWGAVGGVGYLMVQNTKIYRFRRDLYISKIDNTPPPSNPPTDDDESMLDDSAASVRVNRDIANTNKQLSIIGFTLVWLANGVDAFVDAHLKDFDMDEDLSIDFGPKMDDDPYAPMRMGVFVQF